MKSLSTIAALAICATVADAFRSTFRGSAITWHAPSSCQSSPRRLPLSACCSTSISDGVMTVVCNKLGADRSKITPESTFRDMNADSLDIVEVVMALEDEFGIRIPEDEANKITSIQGAIDFITTAKESQLVAE